ADETGAQAEELSGAQLAAILKEVTGDPGFATMMDALSAQMLTRGKAQPSWSSKGIDLIGELTSGGGKIGDQMLVDASDGGLAITRFGPDPIAFPQGFNRYVLVDGVGGPEREERDEEGEIMVHYLTGVAPGFWLESSTLMTRRGNALCQSGPASVILRSNRPIEKWGEEAFGVAAFVYAFAQKMPQDTCTIYQDAGEPAQGGDGERGAVFAELFSPEGEPYAALNMDAGPETLRAANKSADLIANARIEAAF
ncbi:MAG: hypothetical protein HRT63_07955, partial [Erythrobacter sp.]|nr:hypothetical protein [Erythrobacter sp.]